MSNRDPANPSDQLRTEYSSEKINQVIDRLGHAKAFAACLYLLSEQDNLKLMDVQTLTDSLDAIRETIGFALDALLEPF